MAIFATVPSMLAYFQDSYLIGRGVVRNTQLADVVALAVQLASIGVLALTHHLTVLAAVLVWLTCALGATLFKTYLALRGGPAPQEPGVAQLWAEGRVYGLKAWLGSTVNLLSLRQDVLLLAAFAGTREVGIYTVGVAAAELAWYIPNALQSVATAKFSAEEDSLALAQRLNRSVWPFTLAFSLCIVALAAPLIPIVYGSAFKASILPLVLLLPGILATSMSSSLSAYLSGRGHPEDPAFANVVNMLVNLAANVILAPRLGARGAALASSISYSAATVLIIWRFRKRTGSSLFDTLVPRGSDLQAMAGIMSRALKQRLKPDEKVDA
jgi:O-antigen/teichoic acid export membrane protein